MKQILTAVQVTANLQQQFPGKPIKCNEVITSWNGNYFYVETNLMQLVVIGKVIWSKPSIKDWANYIIWCNNTGKMYQKMRTKIGTCIPFLIYPRDKERKEQSDLILQGCGIKSAKKEDDLTRLRGMKVPFYVQVYQIIQGVDILNSELLDRPILNKWNEDTGRSVLSITVTHKTGSFSFPVENMTGDKAKDEQIVNIFLNLLDKPVTSKAHELIAA